MSHVSHPFLNPDFPYDQRIDDLLGRLTTGEKIDQLRWDSPAIERLGIPAYNWWNEALHGVGRNGRATVFPQAIGLSATWDRALVQQVATAVSDEARAKHHAAVRRGSRQQYQGLTFWTPNINIFRDPRWGRGQETWGEDPMLTGELGAAFVRGLQGDNPRYLKTAACAKHFAVHSGPEELRHDFDVRPSKKDLRETYLPAFERLCHEGVEAFMGAYNALYGEPCCGSPFLLGDILRKEWGFRGHVVSDCWAIRDFHTTYKVTGMVEESAALALKSGCDLNCGSTYCDGLDGALLLGLISEDDIDTALRRVLATRFKLGMFDPDDVVPWASISMDIVNGESHRRLAKEAAVQSIVLLQNRDGVLPLNESVQNILVVGPLASSVEAMLGNYYGLSGRISTLIEGLALGLPEGLRIDYRKGCLLNQPRPNPSDWTFFEAAKSDLVLCCMGLSPDIEGEEGDAIESAHKGDRERIELPDCQVEFLRQLSARLKADGSKAKVVVLLFGGSAIAIQEVVEFADGILQVWYPGEAGGEAIAAVLCGESEPGGRLPITVPRNTSCLPPFEDYSMRGRTYRYMNPEDVLFPFGFGLGYAAFRYENLQVKRWVDGWLVSIDILNTSARSGSDVVQCYLQGPEGDLEQPACRLLSFEKISVTAGASCQVRFELPDSHFFSFDADGCRKRIPGDYHLTVSGYAPVFPAVDATRQVSAKLTIV